MKGFLVLVASNKKRFSYHIYFGVGILYNWNILLIMLRERMFLSMAFIKGNLHKSVRLIT